MVNFRTLGQRARELVDKRGGTDALKQDAEELKNIARGQGSLSDKAKAAAEALKSPGDRGAEAESVASEEQTPRAPQRPAGERRPSEGRRRERPGRGGRRA